MTITYSEHPSKKSQATLNALREAVSKALEVKRKLGQYAVFEENGQLVEQHFNQPNNETKI